MPKREYKRTPEGLARHKAASIERKRRNRLDPEFKAKEAEQWRLRYYKDREKHLARQIEWRTKHAKEINERRKLWRRANRQEYLADCKRRHQNTIKAWTARYRRGEVTLDQLSGRIGESLARLDERIARAKRSVERNGSLRGGKTNLGPNET